MTRRFLLAAVAATVVAFSVTAIACGGAAPQQNAPPATTTTPAPVDAAAQAAPGMQQAGQAMQQTGQQTAAAVDFEKLVALLPDVSGWTRGKPKGEQISMGVTMSHAHAEYQKGDASIDLDIADSSFNQLVLSPLTMFLAAGYSERSTEGYSKAAAMGGNPGFEKWNSVNKDSEVTVVVSNRFIVQAKGRGIENIDPVKALVQAVNLGTLATLK